QPFQAAGSLGFGGWEQPQCQGKARTWKLPSRRASCHADLERWHKQKQQEVFRAVDMRCNASLVSRGVPRGERPRRLFRLFLAGQK
ncbi:hypothetical protein, partial [Pseudoflavonifractor capillosus]|uniref:hypothetical protein n=1 Tax=Pseudoflavonifractor capillosus TaxID=106588 RepID=UPI001958A84F